MSKSPARFQHNLNTSPERFRGAMDLHAASIVADRTMEDTIGHYDLVANLWLALKPCLGNTVIEVRYEDLVDDLKGGSRRAIQFLGVGWDERRLRLNERAQIKTVRSPTDAEVNQPVSNSAVGRWRRYQKYFEPHLPKLAPLLR